MQSQRDHVLSVVEERGVRLVQLWFTDVLGTPKSFNITPAELEHALDEGMTFDGSSIDGFSRVHESDVLARPDASTFQVLPWKSRPPARGGSALDEPSAATGAVGRLFCDVCNLDGTPFEGDPRHVLRRALAAARRKGFSCYAAPELEFFYFASADLDETGRRAGGASGGGATLTSPGRSLHNGLRLLDTGSYFELTVADVADELRRETVLTLEEMGMPVEYAQHEDAPSQHEIDLRHIDALTMADTVMTARLVVKEIAQRHGVHATFMPKPLEGVQGSGMHTHFSLFEGDTNAFFDPGDAYGLSAVAKGFIAGLLAHAPAITAVTNQWVNSYKRLVRGYEAPVHVSWARNNRSALVRVPLARRGRPDSTRVEYRSPDPACNPYLAFALVIAAGLDGIESRLELPPEAAANLYALSPVELAAEGIASLPESLAEALEAMESSELVAATLGEHVFEWFLRNKRAEWADYATHVSSFELERYLARL
ncbi:MAG TPA: type I glutamate--ammonia ligase [Acidimicrobiales bacterium]|nr:type I glutamate--ammonia ligase [Acidimicrobiales bacterium]